MFSLFTDEANEFLKLEKDDQGVCLDILDKDPKMIQSYVEFLSKDYKKKGIEIQNEKLLRELIDFYSRVISLEGNE